MAIQVQGESASTRMGIAPPRALTRSAGAAVQREPSAYTYSAAPARAQSQPTSVNGSDGSSSQASRLRGTSTAPSPGQASSAGGPAARAGATTPRVVFRQP